MKSMFNSYIKQIGSTGTTDASYEPNRVLRGLEIIHVVERSDWFPGKARMTEQDHLNVIQ